MRTSKKLAVATIGWMVVAGTAHAEALTIACEFGAYVEVKTSPPYQRSVVPVAQSLTINGGSTDRATLALDGTARATNSHRWSLVRSDPDGIAATVVGDSGDVLTLSRESGQLGPLTGRFKATLISSLSTDRTQTLIGTCLVEGS